MGDCWCKHDMKNITKLPIYLIQIIQKCFCDQDVHLAIFVNNAVNPWLLCLQLSMITREI